MSCEEMQENFPQENKKRKLKSIVCWSCGHKAERQIYKKINFIPKCEKCEASYPEKPKIEAKLSLYQSAYLENRTDFNLNKLFIPINDLTYNIIVSKLKKSAMGLDEEAIQEMVQWTLLKLLSYYKEKPSFKIEGSFTQYISKVVLYPLYNKKDRDKNENEISLYSTIKKGNADGNILLIDELENEAHLDGIFEVEEKLFNETQKELVIKNTSNFIEVALEKYYEMNLETKYNHTLEDNKKAFSNCLNLVILYKHFINRKNERFFTEMWKTIPLDLKDCFDNSLIILKKNLEHFSYPLQEN